MVRVRIIIIIRAIVVDEVDHRAEHIPLTDLKRSVRRTNRFTILNPVRRTINTKCEQCIDRVIGAT